MSEALKGERAPEHPRTQRKSSWQGSKTPGSRIGGRFCAGSGFTALVYVCLVTDPDRSHIRAVLTSASPDLAAAVLTALLTVELS